MAFILPLCFLYHYTAIRSQLSESNEYVNKIKLFLWQRGLRGKATRRGGEERAGE